MTTFRVWAPAASAVAVQIDGEQHAMSLGSDGWWSRDILEARPGSDYLFVLDGGDALPDPRSAWQPAGVNGPSRLVDHAAFEWSDQAWRGMPLAGSVVYELHVGTFTPEGTFDAAAARLDHLVELGVSLVELLPVNGFSGDRGWGYDGVDLYAVHDPYGGPEGLKRFVDACHAAGIGVVMDVVYNHLGPAGNYLARFGPYFTDTHSTPWGDAVNYDAAGSDEVRRFVIDNVLLWLRDYHCDGLRLDAVHAIVDTSATHLLEEIGVEVAALSAQQRRPLFLIAESDLNDPKIVARREVGGYGMDAQWSDDFHHALHAVLTGERDGYYADFGALDDLAAALTQAFVYVGQYAEYRQRRHGRMPVGIPGHRFLGYLQDHDQVGNRARGERSSALMSEGRLKIGAALVLTAPFTPMLFMGEEWGAATPWQYFTAHDDPALAEAVRNGRRNEFAAFGWDPESVPDPQDPATFERSRLDWAELEKESHAALFDWHRRLIALRRSRPELVDGRLDAAEAAYDEDAGWFVVRRGGLVVVCNLAAERQAVPVDGTPTEVLLASEPGFVYRSGAVELDGESVVIAGTI
ncbi:MAG: malto-oligosyltrehalose trehalohydrolase [Actinomycetota bacterium]|nr:malto-oligosyltrehalose trehalohydrolase [Actinomycetota bacterium]